MFQKSRIKTKDLRTYIPTGARVFCILQLCIAFTMVLWHISQPFAGEIFDIKSRLLLYQDVIGTLAIDRMSTDRSDRLERNAARFQRLPDALKLELTKQMAVIQNELQKTFWAKIQAVFNTFAHRLSSYETLWLALSIIIPILLLKGVDGARHAVWILPLLVVLYAAENRIYARPSLPALDAALFPTEQELIEKNLEKPLSSNVFEQQKQLLLAWKRYLSANWAGHRPSNDPAVLEVQAEDGEHTFNLERLKRRASLEQNADARSLKLEPISLMVLYFLWNALFAFIAWKAKDSYKVLQT